MYNRSKLCILTFTIKLIGDLKYFSYISFFPIYVLINIIYVITYFKHRVLC